MSNVNRSSQLLLSRLKNLQGCSIKTPKRNMHNSPGYTKLLLIYGLQEKETYGLRRGSIFVISKHNLAEETTTKYNSCDQQFVNSIIENSIIPSLNWYL